MIDWTRPTILEIAARAAAVTAVPRETIISSSRLAEHVRTRFAIMYVAGRCHQYSSMQIGRRLGRDHSTVISGIRRAEQIAEVDPDFMLLIGSIQ